MEKITNEEYREFISRFIGCIEDNRRLKKIYTIVWNAMKKRKVRIIITHKNTRIIAPRNA